MSGFGTTSFGTTAFGADADDAIEHLADALNLGFSGSSLQTAVLRARLGLSGDGAIGFDGTARLTDSLSLDDALSLVFRELLADGLTLGDTLAIDYAAIARMVDALLLSGAVDTSAEAFAVIHEAMTFGVVGGGYPLVPLDDSLELGDSIAQTYAAIARLVDALALEAGMTPTATLAVVMADTLALGTTQDTHLDAVSVLRDRLDFVLQFAIDDEQYVAWSMNTDSKAASRYTNYPFNSFMRIGDRYYGATDAGLYRLGGADDAGEPINAALRLGMSSLGTRVLKRIASGYLGYTSSGDLRLKVIVADSTTGAREAHVYRLYATGAGSAREGRIKVGKGLKSVYYDFQVENVDGADFELDVIEILPIYLERRIRGNAGGKP